MANRYLDQRDVRRAQQMRASGASNKEIAAHYKVSERTIRRALGPKRQIDTDDTNGRPSSTNGWSEHRCWPAEWTVARLVNSGVRDEVTASRVLLIVKGAQRAGARYAEWFITERVRLDLHEQKKREGERLPFDATNVAWRDLIAAGEPLSEWLGSDEPMQLSRLAVEKHPFLMGIPRHAPKSSGGGLLSRAAKDSMRVASAKKSYGAAARPIVESLRRRIESIFWSIPAGLDASSGPEFALSELLKRLPMPAKTRLIRRVTPFSQIILDVLKHPSPMENQQ